MKQVGISATDVAGAIEEIFKLIQRDLSNDVSTVYFDGWAGFGAAAVLRSIAQALPSMKDPPPELCFRRIIYIDCSRWTSKRVMQKRIAEELRLDHKTMSMFDELDEEDDFNGVDHGSRDRVRSVALVIDRTLREGRFMMIFINGSGDEVLLGRLGIPENSDCMIVWTFSTRCVRMGSYDSADKIAEKLRYTDVLVYCDTTSDDLSSSQFMALLSEEAANIVARHPCMQGVDLPTVVDCCLYGLHLHHCFHGTTGFIWPAHSSNYWICDGIMQQGEREREISNVLHPDIIFECDASVLDGVFKNLNDDQKTPFLVVKDGDDDIYEERPIYYRWISISLKNKKVHEGMQNILERASSIFLALETKDRPYRLPDGVFKLCNNLGVLVLSCCAFSFVSPPFLHCHTLRFLGLEHCTDNNNSNAVEHQGGSCATRWAFLQSLCVLDLSYTDWIELLSKEKMELMANITEVNIEGIRWSHLLGSWLQKRLPHLQRLRIIKPIYDNEAETMSSDINDSFLMNNTTSLEILDMSGNHKGMRKLPASMSEAGHLQVLILDGCDGLEEVVLSGNKSIRSFSFDGYGPAASHRTSTIELPPAVISRPPKHPLDAEKQSVIKTSKVSLEGCTRLDNLFLRGLPNLEELDLSGCPIKVLDFGAMVVDVPRLKRLFLLGCENLRAIRWGSYEQRPELLELICIDTRPRVGCARPLSLRAQQKSFQLQVHAVFVDARLARSLWAPISSAHYDARYSNISITSSTACMEIIQLEATTNKEKVVGSVDHQRHYDIAARDTYCDVFTKVGDGPAPMQAFLQGPTGQLDCHVEIGDGSRSVQSEVEADPSGYNLAPLMKWYTKSLHVHDVSTCNNTMPIGHWSSLRWCRVERCPSLHTVFPSGAQDYHGNLETIWASNLLMARCTWGKGVIYSSANHFKSLRHLHLRCCPSLQFGLVMGKRPSLPSLETLHIIHCGELRYVFVPADADEEYQHTSVEFPKLTTIYLHDLPALQQICEAAEMLAPALETIKIRGCWSLRRLPALKGCEPGMRRPTVGIIEKDVWDTLEWDGVDAGHHPSLYEAPVHSRYYKRRTLRTTVLR